MCSSVSVPQFALLVSLFLGFTRAQTAYESIYTLDAFALQQTCVQSCFTQGYENIQCYTDVLGSMLGCQNSPCSSTFAAMDDCYCRGDLQPAAHDLLSSCIGQLCSVGDNSVILATAASIYSGYCTARGLKASPAQNTADTTSQNSFSASTSPSIQFGSTSSSSTSPSNTQSPSSASTNNTIKVALGSLGGVTVIALVVAVICCWKMRRKKMSANPAPYYLDSMPNSSHQLYPSSGMHFSDGAPEIGPSDSASQMGQSSLMGQSYPPQPDPSVLSTTINGAGGSMLGPRRNAPNLRNVR